jgi:hypothetical protein
VSDVGSTVLQDLNPCITNGLIGGEHLIQQPVLVTHERPDSEAASGGSKDISGPTERGRPEQQEPCCPDWRARESHAERLAPSGRVASDEERPMVHSIEGGRDSFVGPILVVPVRVIAVRSRWLAASRHEDRASEVCRRPPLVSNLVDGTGAALQNDERRSVGGGGWDDGRRWRSPGHRLAPSPPRLG